MSQNKSTEINQQKTRLSNTFNDTALTYDQVGPRFFSFYGRRLVEIAGIPIGSKVLDVATGRGAVLFPAAEIVGEGGKVIGIDLAEKMVAETSEEVNKRGLSAHVEVQQMDAEDLQFPDESFDYLLCGFGIFFFPQLYQALGEFQRVLKPGGVFACSTFDKVFYDEWDWVYEIVDQYFPPDPEEEQEEDPDSEHQPVFTTPEGLTEIMTRAGFEDIQVFSESSEFVYATADDFWGSISSHGFRGIINRIENEQGPDALERFKKDIYKKMGELKQPDGLHQQIPVHVTLGSKPGD
jgi:ubiquinone/menaquinone biosynthesis C-methylase UbiE